MKHKSGLHAIFLLLLLALAATARASSNVFTIEPSKEANQAVECPIGVQSFAGNVSVSDGNIDFFVVDPSGAVLLRYDYISYHDFNVTTIQNGTYVIHLFNRWSANNVTVELFYGRNFLVTLTAEMRVTWNSVSTFTTILVPSVPSNPWLGPLSQITYVLFTAILAPLAVRLLYDAIRGKIQKWKDGESKTPVVLR